jgi:hypothetical protein
VRPKAFRAFVRRACLALFAAAHVTAAAAQAPANEATVRVTRDQTTIWKADFDSAAATVRAGTVLTVIGARGDWYEVVLPNQRAGNRATGFIFKSNVERLTGTLPTGTSTQPARAPASAAGPSPASPAIGLWGFGQFGYTWFTAHDSFDAVLSQSGGWFFGGGGEVRFARMFFVSAWVEHFSKEGERVFVLNGQVFKLGIPDTISMTPIAINAGWRHQGRQISPYAGGGIGWVSYKETSGFADASENVDERFSRYQVVGGIEVRNGWVATAFEIEYSRVPDSLGTAGVSQVFNENNLGGVATRVKVMVGR